MNTEDIVNEFGGENEDEFVKRLQREQREIRKEETRRLKEMSILDQLKYGFDSAVSEGKEVHREAFQEARTRRGEDIEAPRISHTLGTNATFTRARDLLREAGLPGGDGIHQGSRTDDYRARIDKGLGTKGTAAAKVGQFGGTIASDLIQDRTRSLWWLLNAPQAVVSVGQETLLNHMAPSLYKADFVGQTNVEYEGGELGPGGGWRQDATDREELIKGGYASISDDGQIKFKKGYGQRTDHAGKQWVTKQRYRPGSVDSLLIPSGIAMNAGIGLLNPIGGNQGYEAVFADDTDPTKTNNVIGEVAAKYILGRTGNLLNWDEFKEERPDVSKGEYNKYKAFKWDKNADWNVFDDGKFTVPTGVLKGTTEGIHGPEIQFLGRSMPLATTIMPTLATIAGTAMGAAWEPEEFKNKVYDTGKERNPTTGKLEDKPLPSGKTGMSQLEKARYRKINRVRNGLGAGMASLIGSSVLGNMVEGERRRRNSVENQMQGGNAEQYLGN